MPAPARAEAEDLVQDTLVQALWPTKTCCWSHLSLFTYNQFGELTVSGTPINLGVANANRVAIMAPTDRDE
jgi:hypothetical protein